MQHSTASVKIAFFIVNMYDGLNIVGYFFLRLNNLAIA